MCIYTLPINYLMTIYEPQLYTKGTNSILNYFFNYLQQSANNLTYIFNTALLQLFNLINLTQELLEM